MLGRENKGLPAIIGVFAAGSNGHPPAGADD